MKKSRNSQSIEVTEAGGKMRRLGPLPPASTTRWVARRKAAVVAAVEVGMLTASEACHRYRLSQEEFAAWQRVFALSGISGLRVTAIPTNRELKPPTQVMAPRKTRDLDG